MQAQRKVTQSDGDKNDDSANCLCCDSILTTRNTDNHKPSQRDSTPVRLYRNVFDAFICIVKEEGVVGLYTGVVPTMMRAGVSSKVIVTIRYMHLLYIFSCQVLAAVEMSCYESIRDLLTRSSWPVLIAQPSLIFILSALLASFCSALASNPFDMVRSRLMNQPTDTRTGR